MRAIIEYDQKAAPPILRMYLHGAPHRRMHRAVLQEYRKELWSAARAAKIPVPIKSNIELTVTYINPCSPDIDNLLVATFQALDGKCGKGLTILVDDRLICYVKAGIIFN